MPLITSPLISSEYKYTDDLTWFFRHYLWGITELKFSTLLAATYMPIINLSVVFFIRCWNRIRSGGLTSDTMVSCGIWTTIVQIWSRLSVVWKVFWSIHYSREHTSLHGRVCSGRKPQVLKSLWNTRSWLMHRGPVWIRSPTVDSHSGGHQPSTEPM